MLLNDTEIKELNLLEEYNDAQFRAASYDLSVGTIITTEGKTKKRKLRLRPQGIVEIVSREKVKLPRNIAGFAMVKTSLCNKGILALNIGIVDPGYEGYLSTTLLNFGKKEFLLTLDDVFLRLTFIKSTESLREDWPRVLTHEEYIKDKEEKVMNFASTFLNIEETSKQAADLFWIRFRTNAFVYLPIVAIFLTLFTFGLTLGVNFASRSYWTEGKVKADIIEDLGLTKEGDLEKRLKQLEEQIQTLKTVQTQQTNSDQKANRNTQ